jgi:hypothetical protein
VNSEKARLKLGYKPRFDFQRGMELTSRYLELAYEDLRRLAENEGQMSSMKYSGSLEE